MITKRFYSLLSGDFPRVRAFLDENVGRFGEQSRGAEYWEYAHSHVCYDYASSWRNGIWEEDGRIVAVAWFEMELGTAYLTADPVHEFLRDEMLAHAEQYLCREENGVRRLAIEASDLRPKRAAWLQSRGYAQNMQWIEEENHYDLTRDVPQPALPQGFAIRRVSELDPSEHLKLATMISHGFDHQEDGELNSVGLVLAAPDARPDLARVAIAPNGDFAAYAGMWFNARNRYAYLEPLCTHPAYRRMGLAKALLYTQMHELKAMGARYMTGGVDAFYRAIGYETRFRWLHFEKTLR